MLRLRPVLMATVACAVLAACDAAPAPTSAPTTPAPGQADGTSYDDRQLVAALPQTMAQLRVPVSEKCLSLSEACSSTGAPGVAYVQGGGDGSTGDFDVAVRVFRTWDAEAWADHVGACPRGRFEKPVELTPEYGEGSFLPGERGVSRRTDWAVGTWSGFVCQKSLVYLGPENRASARHRSVYALLHNGHHLLRVDGRTAAETRVLAGEYLWRLEHPDPASDGR
ncbi:hypothetical protein [Nocardioides speluncae]|uniref:hypothetical protein n=1 Tax=Nocardioides speluncae TaxID=2670337 RepID=UPI000D69D1DE|nr:hypothetical protein [Nocardioides speluncae]